MQRPHPPVLIAGGGEQLTLRAVARFADACNLVGTDLAQTRHKLALLRRHCDAADRDYDAIEKTHVQAWLLGRNAAAAAKRSERARRTAREPSAAFVGTVPEALDLVGQYQDLGIGLLIVGDRNDAESRELFTADVMPHFA